ncbi:DNA mismatch repair protein Mlh3 [Lampetra planeri]
MLQELPPEVQARLRSGVALSTASQCVEELLLNSLDAGASCVAARLHMEDFRFQVVDNGNGITSNDLEVLGNRYFTSKCHKIKDLENLRYYGYRGEALASIASVSSVVEITSRATSSSRTYTKVIQDMQSVIVHEAEKIRPSHGTTVTVHNFFYNLPVRRKCIPPILEYEKIRQKIEAIALVHHQVSFTLKNENTGTVSVQCQRTNSMLSRFGQIFGQTKAQRLSEINYQSEKFQIAGYIGREGHHNKNLQFIYVNGRLVLKTKLHKLVNILIKKLSIICKQKICQKWAWKDPLISPSKKEGSLRNSELHGIFVLNITCPLSDYDICLDPMKTLIEFQDWENVLGCVQTSVKEFLERENLSAREDISREDIKQELLDNDFIIGHSCTKNSTEDAKEFGVLGESPVRPSFASLEIYGPELQSHSVKRKCTFVSEVPSNCQETVVDFNTDNFKQTEVETAAEQVPTTDKNINSKINIPAEREIFVDEESNHDSPDRESLCETSTGNSGSVILESTSNLPTDNTVDEDNVICDDQGSVGISLSSSNTDGIVCSVILDKSSEHTNSESSIADIATPNNVEEFNHLLDIDNETCIGTCSCMNKTWAHQLCKQKRHLDTEHFSVKDTASHNHTLQLCGVQQHISTTIPEESKFDPICSTGKQSDISNPGFHQERSTHFNSAQWGPKSTQDINMDCCDLPRSEKLHRFEGNKAKQVCPNNLQAHMKSNDSTDGCHTTNICHQLHLKPLRPGNAWEILKANTERMDGGQNVADYEASGGKLNCISRSWKEIRLCPKKPCVNHSLSQSTSESLKGRLTEDIRIDGDMRRQCFQTAVGKLHTDYFDKYRLALPFPPSSTVKKPSYPVNISSITNSLGKFRRTSDAKCATQIAIPENKMGSSEHENANRGSAISCPLFPPLSKNIAEGSDNPDTLANKIKPISIKCQQFLSAKSSHISSRVLALHSSDAKTERTFLHHNSFSEIATKEHIKDSRDLNLAKYFEKNTVTNDTSSISLSKKLSKLKGCTHPKEHRPISNSSAGIHSLEKINLSEDVKKKQIIQVHCSETTRSVIQIHGEKEQKEEKVIMENTDTTSPAMSLTKHCHVSLKDCMADYLGYSKHVDVADKGDIQPFDNQVCKQACSEECIIDSVQRCTVQPTISETVNISESAEREKTAALEDEGTVNNHRIKNVNTEVTGDNLNRENKKTEIGSSSSGTQIKSDWVSHYDSLLEKRVYVNLKTGLSSYKPPPSADLQVACVQGFCTMNVLVVNSSGRSSSCQPFITDCAQPFLPRPKEKRLRNFGKNHTGGNGSDSTLTEEWKRHVADCNAEVGSKWKEGETKHGDDSSINSVKALFSEWENPVFYRPPEVAVDTIANSMNAKAVKVHNILNPFKFTKDMFASLQVIQQVDKKFIVCLCTDKGPERQKDLNILILVDQHAAHERVRLEQLTAELFEVPEDSADIGKRVMRTSLVVPPMALEFNCHEISLIRSYQGHLERHGLQLAFPAETVVHVTGVPVCLVERETGEARRGRPPITCTILEELIREELELLQQTGGARGTLPRAIVRILNSQACHGAVKFGDKLSWDECASLMRDLAKCQLPFQCAHGRPAMMPLANLHHLPVVCNMQKPCKPNLSGLRKQIGLPKSVMTKD